MTVCNMTIEGGGRAGMIAPDETTFAWVAEHAGIEIPDDWRALRTDEGATFDREITVDASAISPQVTWGTAPDMVAGVAEAVPQPSTEGHERALAYMGLEAGTPIQEIALDRVFIGSCTNSRIGDLRVAAEVVKGRTVAVARERDGRAGLGAGQGAGRARGARRDLPRRRLRLARRRLLDVPRHEPRHARAGRALRVDVEPQLRGPSGPRRAHPPRLAADGGRRRDRRALRRHPRVELGGAHAVNGSRSRRSAAPVSVLDRSDVDTDQIMPKQFLKRVERTGFGEFLFYDWAKQPGWDLPHNPILVTGRNFGCGSSREHAPWGLQDYGFKAVIAPSFADIFASNCTKIGLLPVALAEADVRAIIAAGECEIDLDAQEVRFGDSVASFEIDPETKHRLFNGLDDIALTLAQDDAISAYEAERERGGPVTTAL